MALFGLKTKASPKSRVSENLESFVKNFSIEVMPRTAEKIKDFKLLGKIDSGKFSKISSKGDFGGNNFLDVKMRYDENNKKKYLEIYSDKTNPLLTEYSFFEGLTGGKLLFTSIINNDETYDAKLRIEKFKVIPVPSA